jgi:hypothetical protein
LGGISTTSGPFFVSSQMKLDGVVVRRQFDRLGVDQAFPDDITDQNIEI